MNDPNPNLYGIVDMGSNGIRFSISDLSPSSARSLPTVYQSRSSISLYDVQFSSGSPTRVPIPSSVIEDVLRALLRFKSVCLDFGVPETNVRVLATEATRTALNVEEFLGAIKSKIGWEVELLKKEDEGRVGAMGIASSFQSVEGLVMDLGGGSCQITWMISRDGQVTTSQKGPFSFPYGAAALTRELAGRPDDEARKVLAEEMQDSFQRAFKDLEIPLALFRPLSNTVEGNTGVTLYLSGGGFRGWGYLLMSQAPKEYAYPIPLINGFTVRPEDFQNTGSIMTTATATLEKGNKSTFRISKRRAQQVPAVAFLVQNLIRALPVSIREVRFCQGGVREGYLFNLLGKDGRAQDPLVATSASYSPSSAKEIASLLLSTLPDGVSSCVRCCRRSVIQALANTMYLHSSHPKESAATAALYVAIHGALGAAHGVGHADRAALGLMLCERWGAELPPTDEDFRKRLEMVLGSAEEVWWCKYVGRVAGLVGDVYPAGIVREDRKGRRRLGFQPQIEEDGMGKKGTESGFKLYVEVWEGDDMTMRGGGPLAERTEEIGKLGKRKNWVSVMGGSNEAEVWGMKVEVEVVVIQGKVRLNTVGHATS